MASGVDRLRKVVGQDAIKSGTKKVEEKSKKSYVYDTSGNFKGVEEDGKKKFSKKTEEKQNKTTTKQETTTKSGVNRLREVVGEDAIKSGTKKAEERVKKTYTVPVSREPLKRDWDAYRLAEDYADYSAKGAAIKNPSMRDAEGWINIAGWRPGSEDVGNIVTYSRDNWQDIAFGEAEGSDMIGNSQYRFLNDDEVGLYNYLLAKKGKDTAQEYLDSLQGALTQRAGIDEGKTVRDIDNGLLRGLMTGMYGFYSGVDQSATGLKQLVNEEALPTTQTEYGSEYVRKDLEKTGPNVAGASLGQMGYDAASTLGVMAPSVLASAVTGSPAVGATVMGASSAGNAYRQKLNEGKPKDQAATYGVLVGAAEGGLQYALGGISKLGGMNSTKLAAKATAIDNAIWRMVATGAISLGSEITEEELQLFLEPAINAVVFDEAYDVPTLEEIAYTALVTTLSTGVLEGPNIIASGINKNTTDQQTAYEKEIPALEAPITVAENETVDPLVEAAAEVVGKQQRTAEQSEVSRQDVGAEIGSQTNVNPQVGEVSRNARKTVLTEEQKAERAYRNDELYRQAVMSLGDNGAKALGNTYDSTRNDFDSFYAGFSRYYEAGASDLKFESVKTDFARNIAPEVRYAAWTAGQNDRVETLKIEQENAKFAKVYGDDAGFVNDISVEVSEQTADVLNTLGKAVGAKIAMKETVFGGQANGSYQNGVISIASDSQNPIFVVAKHEVTHRMQEMAPTEYRAYRDYAVRLASRFDEVSEQTLVERYKSMAADNDVNLTTEQAMDEIAADFTEKILHDEKELRDFVSHNDKTVVQKFFDAVREFIDKVKKAFKGNKAQMDRASFEAFGATVAELERAEKLWKDTLKATEQRVKQGAKDSSVTEKSSDKTQYSLKDKDYMAAVNKGDMEMAQKMVDEAAKAAGFNVKAYHGTTSETPFTVFKSHRGTNNIGSHFGELETANEFAYGEYRRDDRRKGRVYSVYLKANNPYRTYDWFAQDDNYPAQEAQILANKIGTKEAEAILDRIRSIPGLEWMTGNAEADYGEFEEGYLSSSSDQKILYEGITELLELGGYDSIIYENLLETVGEMDYIVWDSNHIKSADPVTYDDNGNVVPLSKRFDTKEMDIRFSLKDSSGRELTKEQAEYFKDSKVRDENGNLLVVYHGTKTAGFNEFQYREDVQTGTDYGEAFYFTSDYQKASGYSYNAEKDERVAKYKENKDALIKKYLNSLDEADKQAALNYRLDGKRIVDLLDDEDYLTDGGEVKEVYLNLTNPFVADAEGEYYYKVYPEYFEAARKGGHDGIVVKNVIDNPRGKARTIDTYIAFHPDQIKNVTNTKPTKSRDIRFSLKDSQGRTLSKGQQEYFKDSQARDENGNLLVMYHGTRKGGFTKFRDWAYLTANKDYAKRYTDYNTGETMYEVYANITKPFDTRLPEVRELWESEFYGSYSRTDLQESGLPDWTDGYDLAEWIEENDYDFDAILLDEGGDLDESGNVKKRGISYVVRSSEQIKNVDNENPTSDPDIRFSLKKPVEETKNLIAVHNVYLNKIQEALKLGGLPGPSIAITKNDMQHDKYGEISLVFRKDSIRPTDRRNKVYSGDAWTPTRVQVEYEVSEDVVNNFNKKLEELTPDWQDERLPSVDAGTANIEEESLVTSYKKFDRARMAFLREKGKAPRNAMRSPNLMTWASNDAIIAVAKAFTDNQLKAIANTSEGVNQYKNAMLKIIREIADADAEKYTNPKWKENTLKRNAEKYSADNVQLFYLEEVARHARKVKQNKYKIAQVLDPYETRDRINKKFTPKLEKEFSAWVEENTKGAILNKGIRNNKDPFNPSGTRRSFKQLHDPYTLENIVKNMFAEADKGVGFMGGSIFGASQKEYTSIDEIKADSGRLRMMDEEEFNELVREINDDALELADRMKINSDKFAVRDVLAEAIAKPTKKQADAYLRRETRGWAKYSPEYTDELWEIRDRVLNLPTGYFEAKPQRAVGFEEVVAAVIPKGQKELKQQLLDAGVQSVKYYDPKVEGDRLKKINSTPDIAFSMKGQSDLLKENARLKEYNDYLKGQMKVTKFAKQDPKSVEKLAKGLLREYGSDLDQAELTEQLNDVYDYMANGTDANGAPAWNELKMKARKVARDILKNVTITNDELYQSYKGLRDYLRKTSMYISEQDRADLPDEYNDFRRANFGRFVLSNEGTPVDRVYNQLAELYPEFFDADQYTHAADQLAHIVEVLDSLAPVEENPYSYNMNEATEWLANDIVDRFFEIPQKKPTFADKERTKLTKQKIKDADRLARLREQKNQQIERIRQQSRDRISQAIQKEKAAKWDKVEQVKEKQKQKEARMSDSRKRKAKVQQIVRHVNELSKKLNRPSDKHHVPEELRATVAAMLEAINLESQFTIDPETGKRRKGAEGLPVKRTQEFLKLKEQYAKIVEESGMVVDPSLLGGEGVQGGFDAVIAMSDTLLSDMSMAQLETVWKVLRAVEHSITTADKTLSYAKFQRTSEWAADIYNDTETRKSKKGRFIEKLRVDLENPYTFFSHFGDAGKDVFRMLRQAQDKQQIMVNEVRNEVQKIVSPKQVREFEKQTHEFRTERGDKLTLTTAHVMELYELMKRQQSHDHLLQGGIVQPAIKAKKIKRGNDSVLLTINDISKIVNVLTDEQIAIADGLQKLLTTTLSDYGNEASMKAYGYKKFTGKDYWPIKSAKEGIHSNIEKGAGNTRSIKNIGMAQQVIPHANNALDLGGLFQTFSNHAADMIDYSAWLCPMEDAQRLYNFKFREEDGTQTGKTMKGLLNTVGGAGSEQYWHRLMEDIQNGLSPVNDSAFLEPINKVIGNVKGASVGANIRVIVQQPTAILRAAMVLSPQDMIAGMTHGGGWKTALKYSAIAQRKDMGGFDISNPMMMNEILFDTKDKLQRFNEAMMWGAGKADAVTWGRIWNACEHKVKRESPHLSGDSFYKEVDRLFTEVIDSSQVVDGVLQRSQTMRSGNAIMKQATAFMGEPTMAANMLMRAYDAFVNETDGKKRTAARKTFGRTAMVLLVTNAVNALAQSLVDAYRDDEDEEYWDKFWSAFTGLSGDEESLWDKANAAVLSGNLGSSLNPVGYIPVAKDMISILQGYNVTRADADVMGDIMNATKTFMDSAKGDGKKTLAYATKNLAQQVGKVFGVSAPNILRDVWGIARTIVNETGNVELMYEMEKAIYKIDNSGNRGRFIDILYKAQSEGDSSTYNHILEDMLNNGIPASKIESGLKSRAKKDAPATEEPEEEEDDKYDIDDLSPKSYIEYTEVKENLYNEITSDFKAHGFENWDEETKDSLISAALDYVESVALQDASGGMYEEDTKWIGYAQDAEEDLGITIARYLELREEYGTSALSSEKLYEAADAGIDVEMFLQVKEDTNDLHADKDEDGKSIAGSKKEKVIDYLNSVPGMTEEDYIWFMTEVFRYKL